MENKRDQKLRNLALLSAMSALGGGRAPVNPLAGVDLDKEYELIKLKKSKLSANLRRLIVLEKERKK